MTRVATILALVLASFLTAVGAQAQIVGPARVLDGDTIEIGMLRLRLHGIDAPETAQSCTRPNGAEWPCGVEAGARLKALTEGQAVKCIALDHDAYGRVIAKCAAGGVDVGRQLVKEGLAWAYVRFSRDYVADEAAARAARRGVWNGTAQVAWDWRANRWQAASGTASAPSDCNIKGNISASGERIYHTTKSRWYDRIRIDTRRGQRWFCNEAEARAAGWRPAAGTN